MQWLIYTKACIAFCPIKQLTTVDICDIMYIIINTFSLFIVISSIVAFREWRLIINIEKNIFDEVSSIEHYRNEAQTQYNNKNRTANLVPPDYHILFILVNKLNIRGNLYEVNATERRIFYEAVDNFVGSVETFTNNNVHIIANTKEIDAEVSITRAEGSCLFYGEIEEYLKKYHTLGLYDAVIFASKECGMGGAVTSITMFEWDQILHGHTHIEIPSTDYNRVGHSYPMEYPHLYTTNYFIHEWMHQLEGGYRSKLNIIYPFTHAYNSDMDNPTQPWQFRDNYSWNTTYFDDTTRYPYIVEPSYSSYYRAVLACDVKYIPDNNRYVGMYPLFWKLVPRKLFLGQYIIQKSSNSKYKYTEGNGETDTLENTDSFIWSIYYSLANSSLKIKNFFKSGFPSISSDVSQYILTRVGPYDEGSYYLVNKTLSKVLGYSYSGSTYTPEMLNYRSSDYQNLTLRHHDCCYYLVSPSTYLERYLDLVNNSNTEGKQVQFYVLTGYFTAQTWQFRNSDSNYKVHPLKSPTRSLAYYNGCLRICLATNSNAQMWGLEKKDNGKFMIDKTYKICDENNNYICDNGGNSLGVNSAGTEWHIEFYEDNYYKIYVIRSGVKYYFDVLNAYDTENRTVQLQYQTGYHDAQSWKFLLQPDDSFLIVPRLSLTRGLTYSSSMKLTSNPTSWYLKST